MTTVILNYCKKNNLEWHSHTTFLSYLFIYYLDVLIPERRTDGRRTDGRTIRPTPKNYFNDF